MRIVECDGRGAPNATAWDRVVAGDPRGHLLQTWAWGELKASYGWLPLRLAVEQDGSLLAGAQVLYRPAGPVSMAYVPKGPALADPSPEVAAALASALHAASRRRRALYAKVEPEWPEGEQRPHPWLAESGWAPSAETVQPRRTIVIDVQGTEDDILARMKPKWRYNVRLAARRGVEVREAGAEELGTFYTLMVLTGQRDAFGIHTEAYYRRALELFGAEGRATLLIAWHEGQALAGLMPFAWNGQAWYMYGASSNDRRDLMPNHLLQWEAMRWARARGARQYDLWGIPDADDEAADEDLAGVGRFKAGFGGKVVRYIGAWDYAYQPSLLALARAAVALRRRVAGARRTTPAQAGTGSTPNSA